FGVATAAQADEALGRCDVWVLAVKPQVLPDVARGLAALAAAHRPLLVSIAAGVGTDALAAWLQSPLPIVRCMPNTPALIGAGATALYARDDVDGRAREIAQTLLSGAGQTVWMNDEAALDAVTATSGSGPAYFFAFMEAMQTAAGELGLAPDTARLLVLHTALGAARMALESGVDPGTLRSQVTSPGGTTERALAILEEGGFDQLVAEAMRAAAGRSRQLGRELANQ
ncbi:MAG: pyrroline-5-carboxylate reductase, partial [Salinisphaera sp.]|nr:pyrroline-5-carboxylate reductase [Salinisphaera sp.]